MFKHIVMWRFIDGANGKSKKEHALWVKENLEALVGVHILESDSILG